jgi:uncharacterized protein (DUF362 family)
MRGLKVHPIYSQDATVFIETEADKLELMQLAIDDAGFLGNLESVFLASGKSRSEFLIAIKPNIMTAAIRQQPPPICTDPELVQLLVNQIRARGFTNIAVVEAHNVYDYSYRGRTVRAVATMAGYVEEGYRIVDLSEEEVPWDYGGVLGQHVVGRTWRDADYRVSFAKNKTHWQCFYTGCLKNVYGCLPVWDKMRVYHTNGRKFYSSCIDIVDNFPVHFGFLDAWVSSDGFTGHVRDGSPNPTKSIIACANIFALDWVMGEKMQVNPALNFVVQEAMQRWGTIHITRQGDQTPWSPWTNVQSYVVIGMALIEIWNPLARFFSRAFASQQDKRFPPVSRWQWFFDILHAFSELVEPLLESKT